MTTNVTPLRKSEPKQSKAPKATKAPSAALKRRLSRQRYAAGAIGTVAVILTFLSLTHLAEGIELITHAPVWQCWALGIVIDVGFIVTKLATLCFSNEKLAKTNKLYADFIIWFTLSFSAGMNAFVFSAGAENLIFRIAACAFGFGIPAMIFAFTKLGAGLWIDAQRS
jgi:hypothetical protein